MPVNESIDGATEADQYTIEIACSADNGYLPHVSVMLHSLLSHTAGPVRVWLLHGPKLDDSEGMARLEQTVESFGATLRYLPVPDELMEGFPTAKFHYSCWYRILLPDLLPDLDRIVYLDCDIVVTDDVRPLWETDLGDKLFGACVNPLYRPMHKAVRAMGVPDNRDYLNSGVLLLDLERLRYERLGEHLRDYAVEHPDNACPEQDALSVLYQGKWMPLHPRWNVQTATLDLSPRKLPLPRSEVEEAVSRPAVLHFNGPFKPWDHHCRHPLRHLYFEHREKTPWPMEPLQRSSLPYRLMRPLGVAGQYRVILYGRPIWLAIKGAGQRAANFVPSRTADR